MVSKNDPAYRFVKQAEVKEVPRQRRIEAARRRKEKQAEHQRARSSRAILKELVIGWTFVLLFSGLGIWKKGWDPVLLMWPIFFVFITAYEYPEWSRKRKAEREQ